MRILVSALLLAPPAFCMGMMFPLGLSLWRRHAELLPFFWSANGVTSMLASVLGMALSIEFGIARTYALGVCFYVVCALVIVGKPQGEPHRVDAAAPSIQPAQNKMAANVKIGGSPAPAVLVPQARRPSKGERRLSACHRIRDFRSPQ